MEQNTAELATFESGTAESIQTGELGNGIATDANAFGVEGIAGVETVVHIDGHSETFTHTEVKQ